MKSVLVIGKNSYIGKSFHRYCSELQVHPEILEQESELIHQKAPDPIHIDLVSGQHDAWRKADFSKYDCILLLSGIVHRKADPELYYEVNQRMAIDIAKKAKEEQVKQFIFMSTIAVFGEEREELNQNSAVDPVTDYAKSKYYAEQELKEMEDDSFIVAIVRPPMVYGKGCPGNFGRLVHLIQKAHLFVDYPNERSAIYIDNLCEFLCYLIWYEASGIFVPQNKEYLCSLEIASVLKQQGTKVAIIKGVAGFVKFCTKYNSSCRKLFGNYRYAIKDSQYQDMNYQKYSVKESIKQSIKK